MGKVNMTVKSWDNGLRGCVKQAADFLTHYHLSPSICPLIRLITHVNFKIDNCWICTYTHTHTYIYAYIYTHIHIDKYLYFRINNTEDFSQERVFHFCSKVGLLDLLGIDNSNLNEFLWFFCFFFLDLGIILVLIFQFFQYCPYIL